MAPVKYLSLTTLLFIIAATALPREAEAQFGIAGGLNYADFSDVSFRNRDVAVDNASGYHLGAFYDFRLGPLALRPGVFFRNVQEIDYDLLDRTFDVNMIDIPVDVRFRIPAPLVAPYVLAGPVFTHASSSDEDYDQNLNDWMFSANVGAGIEVSVPILGMRLYPEVRYSFGASDYMDDFEFLGANFQAENEAQRMNTWMIRLGVGF